MIYPLMSLNRQPPATAFPNRTSYIKDLMLLKTELTIFVSFYLHLTEILKSVHQVLTNTRYLVIFITILCIQDARFEHLDHGCVQCTSDWHESEPTILVQACVFLTVDAVTKLSCWKCWKYLQYWLTWWPMGLLKIDLSMWTSWKKETDGKSRRLLDMCYGPRWRFGFGTQGRQRWILADRPWRMFQYVV